MENNKIKIAFIKWYGMTAGGTEQWLHTIMANIDKDEFEIDFYYNGPEDLNKKQLLLDNGINLIKFECQDRAGGYGKWKKTDFWKKFNVSKYDFVHTAKAGPKEYPYPLIAKPVVEFVALDAGVDKSKNIFYSFHPSEWQRRKWISMGGNEQRSCVIPVGINYPKSEENLRKELNIPEDATVAGYHQRVDDNIFSPIPLKAFKEIEKENYYFIILGGSKRYRKQAKELGIKNVIFLDHNSDKAYVSKFLNTLDIFAHGRFDGETFGTIFAEALMHEKPCISHKSDISNAHKETMGTHGLWAENQDEYTEKLKQLFEDESLRKQLSAGAREFAEKNYMITPFIPVAENIYRKAAQENKKHPYKYKLLVICEILNIFVRKVVKILAVLMPVKSIASKMRNYGRNI